MAILRFRHKSLERFFLRGTTAGIQANNVAKAPRDMGLPGLHLHPLKGQRRGTWAVSVSGNWRITFAFAGPDVVDVDYEDYH